MPSLPRSARRSFHFVVNAHVYVNDCIDVNGWQDGAMRKFSAPGDEAGNAGGASDQAAPGHDARLVSHVDVLKAMADPLRLNMLHALTRRRGTELPAKTVKELAAELGEPQTKLYRHIKHLESAGLIHSVASRVVSGIVEHRYQA